MGATAQTPANLVIGAGDVTADGNDFGVTADDIDSDDELPRGMSTPFSRSRRPTRCCAPLWQA